MSKSNVTEGRLSRKSYDDSDDWDDVDGDEKYESVKPAKFDRSKRKINGNARRLYENIQDDLRLKALVDGDYWY